MGELEPHSVVVQPMDAAFAQAHINELVALAREIPKVNTTAEELLAEQKEDRLFHAKWQHSFALTDGAAVVGFLLAYEREAEPNDNYAVNTIYINDLVVHSDYQHHGYGRKLMRTLFMQGLDLGFLELTGPVVFSLQTNSAEWNRNVQDFYEALGFKAVGEKRYDDRIDIVMRASLEEIIETQFSST